MDVNYKVSLYKAKTPARWNINKNKGNVILHISNIWNESINHIKLSNIWNESISFDYFVECCIYLILLERICLERGYNKIRIKGGKCNPCCVEKIASEIYRYL